MPRATLRLARTATAAAALTMLVVGAPACGGTDEKSATSATTTPTTASGGTRSSTTAPATSAKFEDTLADLTTRVNAAGNDLCRISSVLDEAGNAGEPAGESQVRTATRFLGNAYTKLADAAPASVAKDADVIRSGAAKMLQEADSPTLDVATFSQQGPTAFSDKTFRASLTKLWQVVTEKCGTSPN